MQLAGIYSPISTELANVEDRIKSSLSIIGEHFSELATHIMNFRGKRIRPVLTLLSAKMTGGIKDQHLDFAVIVELMHNATLVHDDVLDEAEMRRNVQTFNAKWDNELSVLFGDYLCVTAFRLCAKVADPAANRILSESAQDMCLGELTQSWYKNRYDIAESQYLTSIERKTASLFAASCRLGTLFNNTPEKTAAKFAGFGTCFGLGFQIMDDFVDIAGTEENAGKSLGTDLSKGKITLPVIKLLATVSETERKSVIELLSSDNAEEKRNNIARLLNKHGIADYALLRAMEYARKARLYIADFEDSQAKEYMLYLTDYLVQRPIV